MSGLVVEESERCRRNVASGVLSKDRVETEHAEVALVEDL